MAHVLISALLLCGMGLLTVIQSSQIATILAQPGDTVTIWCQHTVRAKGHINWFRQRNGALPLRIVYMMYSLKLNMTAYHFNDFKPDHMVMSLYSKNTSLTILNVNISDFGLYYCGWERHMTFGDGTHLDVQERSAMLTNDTDMSRKGNKKSPKSTTDCYVFHKLTFIFGGIIVILLIIPLTLTIIKIQRRKSKKTDVDPHGQQNDKEPHSAIYDTLQFSKQKIRRAKIYTEDAHVVYSATR
ncbi:uncharacterized protein LOC127455911 [Myxocyprinus asiaticus]|uniref:uncharacterized protein LOC127455911 n=1 Tax=Myxocyprinus asiaticus TaxID=70543 RepID=UPI0022218F37|nr:uncharacterized protein LOC127455911 [Myxocyprinus asiaticus]